MALPIKYNVRNVFVRWRATLATIFGVALVVAVYVLVNRRRRTQKSSRNTGDPRNIMIVRKGSTANPAARSRANNLKPSNISPGSPGTKKPTACPADVVLLISLPRKDNSGEANVTVRGITPIGMQLRPQVRMAEGRWFSPGKREAVVSTRLAQRFADCLPGETFRTGGHELTVVGLMDGGNTAFDSEIWMDADEARSVFDRENYSSVLVRVNDTNSAAALISRIESDKRLPLRADFEVKYYGEQTKTALPIKILGDFLATAMSIGAVFAAMNTMYASVGARTRGSWHPPRPRLPTTHNPAELCFGRSVTCLHRRRIGLPFVATDAWVFYRDNQFQQFQRGSLPVPHYSVPRLQKGFCFL